jgi:hypothetical protein
LRKQPLKKKGLRKQNRTEVHLAFNEKNSFPATFFLLASVKKMAWQDQWSQRVGV